MEEIVKHINDTNASYRTIGAGDAKNTDLFLDNEHYELFRNAGEQITVRFKKKNLQQAILFIASVLPRKYDNSGTHKTVPFSTAFVYDQMAILDAFFTIEGKTVETRTQKWNARKDVLKKNGEIDNRFYFNGLLEELSYTDNQGVYQTTKFTIRNYLAGGYSDLHIKKAEEGLFDVWVTNVLEPYYDEKEKGFGSLDINLNLPLQQIFYGAPGTGKSHKVNETTEQQPKENVFRTTFHPDSDYSTFVGCYKPTMKPTGVILASKENEEVITYKFVAQAFTKAYVRAWQTTEPVFLVIEEINRGNCAQIFGDLFQLLDRNDGVSEYPVDADTDLANFIRTELADSSRTDIPAEVKDGQKLLLPANLYIWATMNTSDQSLFPIDSAFKRRWEWKYIPIDTRKENWTIKVDGADYDWSDFLEKINKKIDSTTHSEDKMLGFYFCKAENNTINAERFVNKVAFYLWNDVFKDYGFDDAIFNDENGEKLSFRKFYKNDGTVEEAKVKTFLDKLGVIHQGETSVDIGEELQ